MQATEKSFPDLLTSWLRYKASLYKQHPVTSNRASQLGGDCERELVYSRTRWQEAAPPPLDLQILFQEGDKHEREILIELQRAGIQVIEQQCGLAWKEFELTGHIDATVVWEGESIPIDVKSMSDHIWNATFKDGSRVYSLCAAAHKGYCAQSVFMLSWRSDRLSLKGIVVVDST